MVKQTIGIVLGIGLITITLPSLRTQPKPMISMNIAQAAAPSPSPTAQPTEEPSEPPSPEPTLEPSPIPVPTAKPIVYTTVSTAGCEQYADLVAKYNWNVSIAMQIMKRESGCNPAAINWNDKHHGCMGSFGLMQVACLHFSADQERLDPETNMAVAYQTYLNAGKSFRPWSTCKMVKGCK